MGRERRVPMVTRVLIADDQRLIREGLSSLLKRQAELEIVGEAINGRQAVEMCRHFLPHVVVMDVTMPEIGGVDATQIIISEMPNVKVIALSMYSDRRSVSEMFRAGASAYLVKDCAFDELCHAIDVVKTDHTYISPSVADAVIQDYVTNLPSDDRNVYSVLSDRERQVLQLIAEGKTTKQIAAECSVSVKTVETHRQNIMEKLGLYSLAELTKYAIREGLTAL